MVEKNTTIQNMFSTVFALSMNKSLNGCTCNAGYTIFYFQFGHVIIFVVQFQLWCGSKDERCLYIVYRRLP